MGQRPSAPSPLWTPLTVSVHNRGPAASVRDRPILNAGPRRTAIASNANSGTRPMRHVDGPAWVWRLC